MLMTKADDKLWQNVNPLMIILGPVSGDVAWMWVRVKQGRESG